MRIKHMLVIGLGAVSLSACATNYGAEGAAAGAALGAGVGAVTDVDVATGAAVGAAAGAVVGSQIKKDQYGGCYRYDGNGNRYYDRDC